MPSKPNILLILADDHGYGDVSMHGGPNIRTPNIDRVADSGVRFTNFYANSSVCSPSRAALMTGRYPDRVGVPGVIRTHAHNNWGYFSQEAVTLPAMLKRGEYRTALIGKWHLGLEPENHPCRREFDHFHGFLGDMMDDYATHFRHDINYMRLGEKTIDPRGHATDLFTNWATEFIRAQKSVPDPFFLCLAYNAPHTPIQPPQEWVDRVRQREHEASDERVTYVALVEHMDHGIGQVLDALEKTGQLSNTLVIYTSDNGGQMTVGATNGPYRGQKGDMYEGGIRVPGCAMWEDGFDAGRETDTTAMLMDLFPTVCETAGVQVDHSIEGISILPELRGEKQDFSNRVYYWVRREGGARFLGLCQHAVRRGSRKLLHNDPFAPLELFDMDADAREQNDILDSDPEGIQELSRILQAEIQANGQATWQRDKSLNSLAP
ncbi:MAG: sulfatase-like hydrolase/transferase [Candidatus Latescibacterota bacterium]|nr:sulfatase-like hydrolase/transferase [Candidatus Latescibacterota bacterium]